MIGEIVGNYQITAKLGEGGMGAVYVAEHQLIGRKAAVKVLLPEFSTNATIVQRFFNEARATALLKHPGLIEVFDFGHLPNGSAYIAMELLEGESLNAYLKRQPRMGLTGVATIGRQVAAALAAAHEKGIVHRDLKPDNIFLVSDEEVPGGTRAKVLDFGIAKLAAGNSDLAGLKTRTGAMMGTPVYMSPEQCRSAGEVDYRSDVYSLGCVLYQMACGRPPFVREGVGEIIAAHLYEAPLPPRSIDPTIAEILELVILRSLAKSPDARQQSMGQLKAELDALVGGRATAETPTLTPNQIARPAFRSAPGLEVHPTTTLGDAASQVEVAGAGRSSAGRWVAAAAVGVGVVAAGIGGFLLFRKSQPPAASASMATRADDPSVAAVRPAASPPAVVAPPVVTPLETKTVPPTARKVLLRIESEPEGAAVYRAVDQVRLGMTPHDIRLDPAEGEAEFFLRLDGFRRAAVKLPADRDGRSHVKLVRVAHERKPAAAREDTSTSDKIGDGVWRDRGTAP